MVQDKRRADLVVPYRHIAQKTYQPTAMFSSTLPLAAMFLRNKVLSWAALFTALQVWLNEPAKRNADSQPGWITVITAVIGLLTCYMDFVMPKRVPNVAEVVEAVASASTSA